MNNTIVCAYAEVCSGPGWRNTPVWVITRDRVGRLHEHCIQQDQQTPEMRALFSVSEAANRAMVAAVQRSGDIDDA